MPVVPEFDQEVTLHPVEMPTANPSAFAGPGRAAAEGFGELSDQMADFQKQYVESKRAIDATNRVAALSPQLNDLQHKWSLVPDRAQAVAGFNTDVAALRAKSVDTIEDPFVKAHVAQSFGAEALARDDKVGRQSFGLESLKHRGDLVNSLNTFAQQAAGAPNDEARAIITDHATAAIKGAEAGGWIQPDKAAEHLIGWKSTMQETSVRQQKDQLLEKQDWMGLQKLSLQLNDPASYPGLLPERKEVLLQGIEQLQYRLEMRAASRQAHDDAMAERNLHQAQAHNEATLLAGVNAGRPLSDVDIQRLADGNQISAGGVEALHAAKDRAEDGRDNPHVSLQLWHDADTGALASGDVMKAFSGGYLSKTTATDLMKVVDNKGARDDSAQAKSYFGVLKTALSGAAIEAGWGDKTQAQATWAQAQGEWHRRIQGGEDPAGVLSDMIPRYAAATNIKPSWLGATKWGTPQSTKDVGAMKAQLAGAYRSKSISQADAEAQADLLTSYGRFFALEDQRNAAAAQARARKPAAASGGAQYVGDGGGQ